MVTARLGYGWTCEAAGGVSTAAEVEVGVSKPDQRGGVKSR